MGGSESKNQGVDLEDYTPETVSANTLERYGEVKGYRNNKDKTKRIAVGKQVFQDEKNFKDTEEICKSIVQLEHDSIIRLEKIVTQTNEEFCSTFWNLNLVYELVEMDLGQEFQLRQERKIEYHESELWHILVSVIAALAYLKSNGYEHNDIRPFSILVNEEGKVKILPKTPYGRTFNCYAEMLSTGKSERGVYLSPIQLQGLKDKQTNPQHELSKTDVYTLGLTVLECALQKNLPEIYCFQDFQINQQDLEDKITQVGYKYSPQLQDFLHQMLIEDEASRPSLETLFGNIEHLCQGGIQVADRLFELREAQFQQPQEVQNNDINPITHEEKDLTPEIDTHHAPAPAVPENNIVSNDDGVIQPCPEDLYRKINTLNETHPDIHQGNETVKRSKRFKDDKAKSTVAKEAVDDGVDPRIKEGIEPVKEGEEAIEYKCSPEVEKILEEYRLKSKIKSDKIEEQMKNHVQSQKSLPQAQVPQPQPQYQQPTVVHQQPTVIHQQQPVVIQQNQQPQYVQQQRQQPQVVKISSPSRNSGIHSQQPTYQQPTTTTTNYQPATNTTTPYVVSQGNVPTPAPANGYNSVVAPQGYVRKDGIPAGATLVSNPNGVPGGSVYGGSQYGQGGIRTVQN